VGAIEIIDPYLPVPRGRYAASVYLTIRNGGGRADELVAVGTAAARSTLVMAESDHGSVGSVAAVAELTIPAHRSVALVPGRFHLALSRPRHRLTVGEDIVVTLRFARAGAVAVEVPVVAVAVPAGAGPAGGAG
jgi:copper(I)-binding protein